MEDRNVIVYDFNNLIFYSEAIAENILQKMKEILDKHGYVRVSDFYSLSGREFKKHHDEIYGWTDLDDVRVIESCGGYMIKLSDPMDVSTVIPRDLYSYEDQNYKCEDKMVSHPNHYQTDKGLETIDVIEAFTSGLDGIEAFDTGTILKYMCRWKKKNDLQDLNKAMWYLTHLINHVKNNKKEND